MSEGESDALGDAPPPAGGTAGDGHAAAAEKGGLRPLAPQLALPAEGGGMGDEAVPEQLDWGSIDDEDGAFGQLAEASNIEDADPAFTGGQVTTEEQISAGGAFGGPAGGTAAISTAPLPETGGHIDAPSATLVGVGSNEDANQGHPGAQKTTGEQHAAQGEREGAAAITAAPRPEAAAATGIHTSLREAAGRPRASADGPVAAGPDNAVHKTPVLESVRGTTSGSAVDAAYDGDISTATNTINAAPATHSGTRNLGKDKAHRIGGIASGGEQYRANMAVVISSSMYGSPWRAAATTTTLLLALAAAAAGLLLAPVAARGSPEHDKQKQQQREDDRILGLPGQPNGVAFGMYGGYVTIDDHNGRALYYWFQEADADEPGGAPLVLWLNGGPGCSSIGLGAMQELGAFRVHTNGERLLLNEYAWNKAANILFVESPAGVGFSYSNTSSDLSMGDDKMAQDTYTFLVKWFERFPHYKYREFYIAGESGHFIPQLAQVVYRNNAPFINFQGLLVSSGLTNDHEDMIGMFESWWHHGLISDETLDSGLKVCPGTSFMHPTPECTEVWNKALAEQGHINPYTIYTPTCDKESPYQRRFWTPRGRAPPPLMLPPYDPCAVFNSIKYLNLPEVQKALHANISGIIEYPWAVCSNTIFDNWGQAADDLLPVYRELIQAGLRVWVFSGDTDSVVPLSSTRRSLAALGLPVKTSWYPWYMAPTEREVGGWSVQYEGLTYITVRGAGHLVPVHRPAQAFLLFKQFLKGEPMPAEEKHDILLPSEKKAPFY